MVKNLRAFTLIELLVSLSILAVIAAISATSFVSIRRSTMANIEQERRLRDVRRLFELLDREFSAAYFMRGNPYTRFVSRRQEINGKAINDCTFCTIREQSYYELGTRDELIMVNYSLVSSQESTQLKYELVKKSWLYPSKLTIPLREEDSIQRTVLPDCESMRMRFYKDGAWFNSWDTKKRQELPQMIEIFLEVDGKQYIEYFNVYISEMP